MLSLGRTTLFLLVGLSVVYACLYFYWRSGVKMRLEEDWVMEGRPGEQSDWVNERLAPRARRIRSALVLYVYVLPILVIGAIVWITN